MKDKKTLRKEFSALRKELNSPEKDNAIALRLLDTKRLLEADTILLYASFGSEINTFRLAEMLLLRNKTIAFPRCGKNGHMTFHNVSSLSQLSAGSYGIPEPASSLPQPQVTDKTVCIVPGLTFTPDGGRLGYGGGFYDRFLSDNPCVYTIAVAYDAMIVNELPLEPHDLKVNSIVTEERMVLCNE